MKPIVIVGSLNMDLVVHAPRLPNPGETILGGPYCNYPGGKGANQAVAISRMGGHAVLVGMVGVDAFGDQLLIAAEQDGVDISCINRDTEEPTGVALITVDEKGQNTIVVVPGANGNITTAHIESHSSLIQNAALLVLQLECPLEAVQAAAYLARQAGVPVLLNPAPARSLPRELLSHIDIIVPNEGELARLVGSGFSVPEGARRLSELGIPHVLVTLGEKGFYLISGAEEHAIPAYRVAAVDTVAAGDAFVGALAVAVSEGVPHVQAARWANAAGALAVTRRGAQPSLPRRGELEDFLREYRED